MPTPFPDRSDTLFGRAPDLAYLLARTERPGVTFLFGPSQMGKSTLLKEVARRRSQPVPETFLGPKACLPGYTESQGQSEDLFLRAVADLYTRWITDATFAEQARMVTKQQQSDFIGRFGEGVGSLFEKVSKLGGKPAETVGGIVRTALETLAQANRDLQSGGLQLTPLSLDQGRNLLTMVYDITQRPILLILDQWEKARLPADASLLESLVRHLEDWPPCHILVGSLPLPAPQAAAESLQSGFPYEVESHTLPVMHLDDPAAASDLLTSVRQRVPAAAELDDGAILDLIAGHPEVVNRWTKREPITTVARMKQLADEAHNHRYSELRTLATLPDTQRLLAMRLALLPVGTAWSALKPILTESTHPSDLDQLHQATLLERSSSTLFGHTKRAEVALQTFVKSCPSEIADVADRLCLTLAATIRNTLPEVVPQAEALVRLQSLVPLVSLAPLSRILCQAASSLVEQTPLDWDLYLLASEAPSTERGMVAALLAMGLFNTLNHAKQEDDLPRRDSLLDALRNLATQFPQDAAVREQLAMGLFNTLNHAKQEDDLPRRDSLLDALRNLATQFPQDAAVRERLANGLFNTLNHAKQEDDLPRRDSLLDALRTLATQFPQDGAVREQLGKGLVNTLIDAKQEDDLPRRDSLLDALRNLATQFPQDAAVRERLAKGLLNTLNDAKQEDDLPRRDSLLDALRTLATQFPQDGAVREQLGKGLVNTLIDAKQEDDLPRRDSILDALHTLATQFPQDGAVREQLAMGLFNTLIDAKQEDDLPRRDSLLDGLRTLATQFPQDAAVREGLIKGIAICLINAQQAEEAELLSKLRTELQQLARQHPEHAIWSDLAPLLEVEEGS